MSDASKIFTIHCSECNIIKEIALKEENMPSKDMGIWPFFSMGTVYCSKCLRIASFMIKE